jgi:hypothetical protein
MGRNLHCDKCVPDVRHRKYEEVCCQEDHHAWKTTSRRCPGDRTPSNWWRETSPVSLFYLNVMGMSIRSVYKVRRLIPPKTRGMYAPSYDVHSYTGESIGMKPKVNLVIFIPVKNQLKFKGDAILSYRHPLPHFFLHFIHFVRLYCSQLSVELRINVHLYSSYDSLERGPTCVTNWKSLLRCVEIGNCACLVSSHWLQFLNHFPGCKYLHSVRSFWSILYSDSSSFLLLCCRGIFRFSWMVMYSFSLF